MFGKLFSKGYGGLRRWMLQRLSAIVLVLYLGLLAVLLAVQRPHGYLAWKALFEPQWMRVATLLSWASLLAHAWLGVRDIYKDYVPALSARRVLVGLTDLALVAYLVWMATILWSI